MNQELAKETKKDIFSFDGSMVENMQMAEMLAHSDLVPQDYKNKPSNVIVAVQMGQEVGLKPMQALQGIAVINGRPCIWGDALIGLVRNSNLCEYVTETFDHEKMTATCVAKRFEEVEKITTFSREDAIRAGLWNDNKKVYSMRYKKEVNNTSPWYKYPKRMLQMRARGFCLRDLFPDVLKGLANAEEQIDAQPIKQVNEAPTQSAKASKVNDFIQDADFVDDAVSGVVIRPNESQVDVEDLLNKIELSQSIQELSGLAVELAKAGDENKPQLRAAYSAKNKQLQGNEK